jgi:TolB-like protein
VLPFVNLTGESAQEWFADAITDDLTTDLSRITGSFVIARNTAFTYKGKSVDVKQIGRDLGVYYVLEGSVRRTGEELHLNVQLIDSKTGAHVWADRFDYDHIDLTALKNQVTGRIARALNITLRMAEARRSEREHATNPDARDYTMRGWALLETTDTKESLNEGQRLFERALELDDSVVDALIGLANVLMTRVNDGWSETEARDVARAEELLTRAMALDPSRPAAHHTRGHVLAWHNRLDEALFSLVLAWWERGGTIEADDGGVYVRWQRRCHRSVLRQRHGNNPWSSDAGLMRHKDVRQLSERRTEEMVPIGVTI